MKRLLYVLALVPVLLFGCSDFAPESSASGSGNSVSDTGNYEFTTPEWLRGSWICPTDEDNQTLLFVVEAHEISWYDISDSEDVYKATVLFSVELETEADGVYTLNLVWDEVNANMPYKFTRNTDGTVTFMDSSYMQHTMTRSEA